MVDFPQFDKHPINGCCHYRNGTCIFTYKCEHRHSFFRDKCDYQSPANKQWIAEAEEAGRKAADRLRPDKDTK